MHFCFDNMSYTHKAKNKAQHFSLNLTRIQATQADMTIIFIK
jgi:hypothetical protein